MMTALGIVGLVLALGFGAWVFLRLMAPTPKPHSLTGVTPPIDIWWWIKSPDVLHEETPIRRWEWAIAYAVFGVVFAINWPLDQINRILARVGRRQ